jgi:N-acylglucosamine-6-phosphate 2-epimerase
MAGASPAGTALASLRHRVVVSCQAPPGNPMRSALVIARIAASVVAAGAGGVRIDSPEHITAVKKAVDTPLIGLWKEGLDGVYITPTLRHARAVVEAGADIVAVDGTGRPRPDGRALAQVIDRLHSELGAVVLADVGTVAEGLAAAEAGADAVATTLAGLSGGSGLPGGAAGADGPALDVVGTLAGRLGVPVIAEGGIVVPGQAQAALEAGAWCVVIGKAITSPDWITARFVAAVSHLDGGPARLAGGKLAVQPALEHATHAGDGHSGRLPDGGGSGQDEHGDRRLGGEPCDT